MPFSNLVEYDEQGKVVWVWRSADYFRKSDLYFNKNDAGITELDAHANSFFFDEESQSIFVSFKNISRIIKIKYPEGTVQRSYGETFRPGAQPAGNGLYCGQHSIRLSKNGYLYLYNNNSCTPGDLPKILKLQEPAKPQGSLKKIWEYDCSIDDTAFVPRPHSDYQVGGDVIELPDDCLFINMSGEYCKVFIIDTDRNVLWSALPEKWNTGKNGWMPFRQYRASVITRAELESLVWNAEQAF